MIYRIDKIVRRLKLDFNGLSVDELFSLIFSCIVAESLAGQGYGQQIGISSGRIISYLYNSMISLAFIAPEYAVEGTEVTLLWGTPGTPQKEIRATVAKYPYNKELIRNEDRDVSEISDFQK